MSDQEFDIKKISELARIDVATEKEEELTESLKKVLAFVSQIQETDVPNIEPKNFFRLTKNRLRHDSNPVAASTYKEEVLRVVPNKKEDYIQVKKIISKTDD